MGRSPEERLSFASAMVQNWRAQFTNTRTRSWPTAPRLMQTYCDVLRLSISIIDSDQGPAWGSAIHAAVAAGAYPDVRTATEVMGKVFKAAYPPNDEAADAYDKLFAEYSQLYDDFGRGANDVMRRLKNRRREVLS